MLVTKVNANITHVGDSVILERGCVRRKAIATEELLSNDVTQSHYVVGRLDALGKEIVLGEEMAYIDWKSSDRVWYIYSQSGKKLEDQSFVEYEDALNYAMNLTEENV